MQKLTQNYPVTSQMRDFCRTFERDLTAPQMGRVKELLHGIIRGKRAILSEIARQNRKKEGKSVRKQVQQYSEMLLRLPLINMVTRKLAGFRADIHSDTPLYYDLTDISKLYHKSMEAIGSTWNGSEGQPGKGYEIIDISLGYEGGCVTLIRHTYSTAEASYKSQNDELRDMLSMMQNAWGEIRGTLFFDAGADSDLTLQTLIDAEAPFCIRMNVNRGEKDRIFLNEEGEAVKMMDLWRKEAQGMAVWKDKKGKKTKIVQLSWTKAHKEIRGELTPLYLVRCHRGGDPDPCVFLTGRAIETEADAAKIYHQYFARGAEEAVFKCHKDKLGMEEVQLQSLNKIKQMMWLYALADQLLYKLHCMALEVKSTVQMMVSAFLKGTQRAITKWAMIDWYDEYWGKMERLTFRLKCRYPPPDADVGRILFFNPAEKW
jgi:hypothetical protein